MRLRFFRRQIALPSDHGTWAFFLSPLLIGLCAGGRWSVTSTYLVVAALSGFLLRQPLTTVVKILSGRRRRRELGIAVGWSAIYLAVALAHLVGLALRGYGFVLILAVPGVLVFAWYLVLVARRDERRQKGVEIVGAGVLALSAPAAYWIGLEWLDGRGWGLWILCWAFSTMSINHVYARLEQLRLGEVDVGLLRQPGRRALGSNTALLALTVATTLLVSAPPLLPLPFLLQWAESAQSAFAQTPPTKPTVIGFRQLLVSTIFTAVFIALWK